MARERDRIARVQRLRSEARRARHLAAQVTDPDDLEFYRKLAEEWDQEADRLEQAKSPR